jgi:hypothetical protein
MSNQRINVKVPTAKLIKALETALAQRIKEVAQYKTERKAYEVALEVFNRSLESLIGTKKLHLRDVTVRNGWRDEPRIVQFEYTILDSKIQQPEAPHFPHRVENEIGEIKNAIAVLKLTDDETVSTSTYNNVAKYL